MSRKLFTQSEIAVKNYAPKHPSNDAKALVAAACLLTVGDSNKFTLE